jgi:nucleoside-diphosphate-sugar epimerase
MKSKPSILVTGGSGYVGQFLVRELNRQGHSVVSMYHHRLPETHDLVYPVCSDMSSAELLAAPLRGVDTVVHLAWEGGLAGPKQNVSWDPVSTSQLPTNIKNLRNLTSAMEKAGTNRLIFLSASGACRGAQQPFLKEKYLGEFFALNSDIAQKVIIRPSIIWGSDHTQDPFVRSIKRVMKYPVYPVPRQTGGINPIHVEDLARMIAKAATIELAESHNIIDIQGKENISLEAFFKLVSEKYLKGTRLPLRGLLGESILPIFERSSDIREIPRISNFLALGDRSKSEAKLVSELVQRLPLQEVSIKKEFRAQHILDAS